jgi:hypothetical protein
MSEPKDGRWAAIYEAMTGATAPGHDHDHQPTGTDGASIKAGHEPDQFDARGLLMVPVLVVVVTGLAYVLVTSLFSWFEPGQRTPGTNPQAVAESAKGLNERINRISSTDPSAEVRQPRLEYVRNFPNSPTNNTYELTPRDLYPNHFVDPMTGKRLLSEGEWLNKDKTVARIPVDEAIRQLAGKMPHKDGKMVVGTNGRPNLANGGQPITPAVVKPAKPDDHNH